MWRLKAKNWTFPLNTGQTPVGCCVFWTHLSFQAGLSGAGPPHSCWSWRWRRHWTRTRSRRRPPCRHPNTASGRTPWGSRGITAFNRYIFTASLLCHLLATVLRRSLTCWRSLFADCWRTLCWRWAPWRCRTNVCRPDWTPETRCIRR